MLDYLYGLPAPLFLLLPLAAFLYASVGHGGASSYLMLLALWGFTPASIRPTALVLNMVVSLLAFANYRKACQPPWRLFWVIALCSVPAAYLGGKVQIDPTLYKQLLGALLLFPILRLSGVFPQGRVQAVGGQWWLAPLLGASIGFLSGLVGIGGGIILSPVLLLLGWADLRQAAAMSALFIFLNSLSGFAGAGALAQQVHPGLWWLLPLTVLAGALGAYLGAHCFDNRALRYLLTLVLGVASVKLMLA